MNLKTFAQERGISLAEAKELTGLTHWNQSVDHLPDAIPAIPKVECEPSFQEEVAEECPFDLETIALSVKIHGEGSACWKWRHLL